MKKPSVILDLLLTFMKVGLFTFGGGYAMISVIENSCVEEKKWITHDEMMNVTVIAESTPGPIAINCATYVGYKRAGFSGAVAATLGIVLPSFLIIYLIAMYMGRFLEIEWIASAFKGIQIAVGVLIAQAGVNMVKKMPKKKFPCAVMISACLVMLLGNLLSVRISSVLLMIVAGMVSLALFSMKKGGAAK